MGQIIITHNPLLLPMSHWQQEPIRYFQTSTPQPSDTIRSLRKKIEEYQLKFRHQQEEIQRLLHLLQSRDQTIKHLQHSNQLLTKQVQHYTIPSNQDIDSSMHQFTNVSQLNHNLNQKIHHQDIKKFRIEDNRLGGQCNRSFVEDRRAETSVGGSIKELSYRSSTRSMEKEGGKSKHTVFKMFEGFLIVEGNLLQLGQSTLDSNITLSYPSQQPADRQKIVPMFCYPHKMKPRLLTSDQQINRILEDQELQSSIFILNSEFTTKGATQSRVKNIVVSEANPNFNLFGVCLRKKVVAQLNNNNYQLSKTYVILTYLPFVRFFLNLLAMTINAIKTEEVNSLDPIPNIQRVIIKSFEDLSRISIDRLPATIKFRCQGNNLHLSIPEPPYTDSLTSSYALSSISKIDPNLLVDIILLMLIESSIVIYSKDATLLSQLILLLIQIIRPLRYPHPIIVNLPKEMEMVLESPFPTLIGLTTPISHLESQSVYFNIDAKQQENAPDMSALRLLGDHIRSSIQRKKSENDIFNKIKYVIETEIITAANKDKQTPYRGYLEIFKKTQIYKYYCQ